jgi:hypothetical protein
LQSMLTEPVGPRSPDEILAVVYHRTERTRRRRRQQVGVAVAAVAFAVTGLASLRSGDDEASRVRVVDGEQVRTEESTETSTPPTTSAGASASEERDTTSTTRPTGARPQGAVGPTNATSTTTTTPVLPTTTTLPATGGPDVRTLAQASDAEDDAVLPGWYYDIVSGSMRLDLKNDVVVFTTRYASPDSSGDRDNRTLRSEFEYANDYVTVSVTETDNALGTVHIGPEPCANCARSFDEGAALLTVTVPVDVMNDYLQRLYGNGKTIEQAADSVLNLFTVSADLGVEADETEGAQ